MVDVKGALESLGISVTIERNDPPFSRFTARAGDFVWGAGDTEEEALERLAKSVRDVMNPNVAYSDGS